MLYFGGGEGEGIIKNNQLGWVAKPANYHDLNEVISTIKKEGLSIDFRKDIQRCAIDNFNFDNQLDLIKDRL